MMKYSHGYNDFCIPKLCISRSCSSIYSTSLENCKLQRYKLSFMQNKNDDLYEFQNLYQIRMRDVESIFYII